MTEELQERSLPTEANAGGGRANDISREESRELSLPIMSVDDAGVGGRPGRGMMVVWDPEFLGLWGGGGGAIQCVRES